MSRHKLRNVRYRQWVRWLRYMDDLPASRIHVKMPLRQRWGMPDMSCEELTALIRRADADILAALDEVVDTEKDLAELKARHSPGEMRQMCDVGRRLVGIDVRHQHDMRTPCPEPAVAVRLLWQLSHEISLCRSHLGILIQSGDVDE